MATIKSAFTDDVVRNANIIETMAAGIVGGIATPMIRAVIPASIPYSGLVADGIQIVGGVMAGKAVGGSAGVVIQNGLVIAAAADIGNMLFAMVQQALAPQQQSNTNTNTTPNTVY